MATRNETHVHDISTLANFKDWAMSIGAALAAFGWVQTADTGQVNWGTIASVPTSGNYVFEIWKPGDAGTTFYIRIDYGNNGGNPGIRIQGGTTTNGAGTLTGFTTVRQVPIVQASTGATGFNCLYCGDSSSFAIMMWRDASSTFNFVIAVDRSRNTSGATTNSYFSVMCTRDQGVGANPPTMQSVVFGVGAAPQSAAAGSPWPSITGPSSVGGGLQSMAFNGNIGITPVFPFVGYFDVPTLQVAYAAQSDFAELNVITTTVLGASHTYIYSKNQNLGVGNNVNLAVLMRWE